MITYEASTYQYVIGHSDIGMTHNVYTLLGQEDVVAEMARMEAVEEACARSFIRF